MWDFRGVYLACGGIKNETKAKIYKRLSRHTTKKDLNLQWFEHVIVFFIVTFYLFGVWMLWDIFYF